MTSCSAPNIDQVESGRCTGCLACVQACPRECIRGDLPLLQGSKYLQSDTSDTFSQVRDDLERGLEVLFSGTPCQVAGLCSFLGHGYPGLATVDLICHGVSSPGLWKHHLSELKKRVRGEITSISFREKTRFEKSAYAPVLRRRFSKTVIPSLQDAYYGPYLKGYTLRESCHRCSYASPRRPGDITIGDCATMEDDLRFHPEEMLSTVLVNTPRGREVFAGLAGRLHLLELDVAEEAKKSAQLHAPCVC